ncbi:unnamed protein product [Durusdinium trenchii]|uniref:Uncharacterized protein n=1 Tax=Durusdinium trenchii TaxID=1381693 RepID=A0ABP0NSF6_9DINO
MFCQVWDVLGATTYRLKMHKKTGQTVWCCEHYRPTGAFPVAANWCAENCVLMSMTTIYSCFLLKSKTYVVSFVFFIFLSDGSVVGPASELAWRGACQIFSSRTSRRPSCSEGC